MSAVSIALRAPRSDTVTALGNTSTSSWIFFDKTILNYHRAYLIALDLSTIAWDLNEGIGGSTETPEQQIVQSPEK